MQITEGRMNLNVIAAIRRVIFADADKNRVAPHIFLTLCVYAVLVSVYTGAFFGVPAMLVRLGLSLGIVTTYVIIERSPLSIAATAFLSPTLITSVLIFGAIYFHSDFLIFLYNTSVAFISLTYLRPKSLALYVLASAAVFATLLFVFRINLLGPSFTPIYNVLYFAASVAMNILVYTFSKSYTQALESMTQARNEASLAAQAKSHFLANMSHEMRTPLNAVIGLTEAELRRADPQADMSRLRKIHASGSLLMEIINDLLDMSKIDSGKFELVIAPYSFADMVYDVATLNMVRIGAKPVVFVLSVDEDIPQRMRGDELRIKQLISNLLSNAIKYTNEGSVELRVKCRPEGNGVRLLFDISDTGTGIREEDLGKLFAEYSQVDLQNKRGVEGTGLGLTITKGLTDLMGGTINAHSEYGKGSVFSVELYQDIADFEPLGTRTAAALREFSYLPEREDTSIDYTPLPHARVLVVDDIEINLEVAAACLEPYGMTVECTDNGAEAVRLVNEGAPYDLIFMDHMMPGMDGVATMRAIRGLGTMYAQSVPIIVLTANALVGNEDMFAQQGFQGFLPKPIDLKKLDELLRRWVK